MSQQPAEELSDRGYSETDLTLNQGWVYREQIGVADQRKTVLAYYCHRYRHSSQDEWRSRIHAQQILLNDQPTTPSSCLKRGDWLTYHRLPWTEPDVPLSFKILWEDEDLLVIKKPSGLPVMPGGGFLEHTLLWQLKQQYPQDTPIPIHRLGRGTSGLLLLARSPLAKSHLSKQMRESTTSLEQHRRILKTYLALVEPGSISDRFTIDTPIGKIPHPSLGYLYAASSDGKFAHSEGTVLEQTAEGMLVEVTIFTGRPHQIRIHMAALGCPLIGDPLYGVGGVPAQADSTVTPGEGGYFLHAHRLSFIHPRTQAPITLECPPPHEFCQAACDRQLSLSSGYLP
jgi:23S rRNA pseudouridine1911/1915/1917 synthase